MRKIIIALAVISSAFTTVRAQNLLNKVPATASVVIKYSGENFSKNLPLKKLDAYGFVKDNLFKILKIDTLASLENMGINFEKDTYQYISMQDSSMSFVSLLNLKDVPQFLQLIQASYHAEMKPEKKNGYEFLTMSPNTYIGWNEQQAVLVVTNYQNPNSYYREPTTADTVVTGLSDSTVAMVDSAVSTAPPIEEKIETIKKSPLKKSTIKKQIPGKKKAATATNKYKKGTIKKPVTNKKAEEIIDGATEDYKMSYEDSVAAAKRDTWYTAQEKMAAAKQKQVAENIITTNFNSSISSIDTDISYKKLIDPAAHVTVWLNYENILKQYWPSIFKGIGPRRIFKQEYPKDSSTNGFRSGMNMYFEKDKMRIDQKMYSPDEKMANLAKEIFSNKQSNSLINFVNPDNVGYLSMSINTEAMENYYYKLLRQYLGNAPYMNEYADVVDVYMDLLEIIIDEKAIAELMPGNYLFVLHDMKTKTVTYTDYVYDEKDFTSKEVKKTKQELSPNFTFVMETKKEGFMQKLAKLPLKYAKKEKYNYQDKGGYYELAFDADKYPISSLYFMVKDGKLVITTSKASIDMAISNTGYALDADTKNSILNNNYSLKINSKKLIQQINPELSTNLSKKISSYLEENIGDVKMESSLKDGLIQATVTMGITGNHANSLEFFFNMIDAINHIMEDDKLQREKKID